MFYLLSKLIVINILGWKVVGSFTKLPKVVVAVYPHTSNYDFALAIMIRTYIKEEINYVGKKELFNPLTAWFFKGLGGAPLNRKGNQNIVEGIVDVYKSKEKFRLAIAPEGTRNLVDEWKTGFYYIAKGAEVPIQLIGFDYPRREVVFYPLFTPTDNIEADFKAMKSSFKGVKGKNPDKSILIT